MERRWRWPPETEVPPWATGVSMPSGSWSTNSADCDTSSAQRRSSSVASGAPKSRLLRMVPENSSPCCGT